MEEKIKLVQDKLKELGYFTSEEIAKIIMLFERSGKRNEKRIPTLLLKGESGAGKTFLAEIFSKMINAQEEFVQCFPRMGTENFQYDVNIESVIRQNPDNAIKSGILLKTLEDSKKGPVVLIIDELDKARPEVDSFLLDFLENGRLSTGTDTYQRGEYPIYVFITSNDKREIDNALINRSKKMEILRPEKELFLEILGLPVNHYLGYIYDKCSNFSIRQAKQYLQDIEELGVDIDEDALSQYINLEELNVVSLADIQKLNEIDGGEQLNIRRPNLSRCLVRINRDNIRGWEEIFQNDNKENFEIIASEEENGKYYVAIDTVEQLRIANEHINFNGYNSEYSGWFECSNFEFNSDSVIWAKGMERNSKFKLGIQFIDGEMFEIAVSEGKVYVNLSSTGGIKGIENYLRIKGPSNEIEEYDDYDDFEH